MYKDRPTDRTWLTTNNTEVEQAVNLSYKLKILIKCIKSVLVKWLKTSSMLVYNSSQVNMSISALQNLV